MIERSPNVPPEAIVHSNTDHSLPEYYDAIIASDNALPEHYDPKTDTKLVSTGLEPVTRSVDEKQTHEFGAPMEHDGTIKPDSEQKTYCGLRPKIFYLCLLGALLVIIGAAVGGGVGHSVSNRKQEVPSASLTDGNSQSTVTTTGRSPSGTSSSTTHLDDSVSSPNGTVRSIRGIAATEVNINIFLIHQDEAGDFSYMTYYNEGQSGWKDRVKIPLDSPAAPNTSIACTSWNTTGTINVRSYYVATNSILQEIVQTCGDDGTGCTTRTAAVSGNIRLNRHAGIAAAAVADSTLRIYILDDDGNISELQYNPGPRWGSPTSIGNMQADPLSPLAVAADGTVIHLFWFTRSGELQYSRHSSSWSIPRTLATVASIPASLSAASSPAQDAVRVFYPNGLVLHEVRYSDGNWGNATELTLPPSSLTNGPVAAVGWNGTEATRLYYYSDGTLREAYPRGSDDWVLTSDLEAMAWAY